MAEEIPPFPAAPGPILATGLRLVEQQMALIPPGQRRVMVFYRKPNGEIGFGAAFKINDQWAFAAEVEWNLKERPDCFVGVRWSS